METQNKAKNYSILAQAITERYVDAISGRLLGDTFVAKDPSEKIMIGKLDSNRVKKTFDRGYVENKSNQFLSIPSINISFKIKKNK